MTYRPPARKPFEYGELITGAFRLVWRHKFLWFFGLFAGTGSSLGGWNCNFPSGGDGEAIPSEAGDWIDAHITLLLLIVAAVVIVGIILWLWSILCQGAVIRSVMDIRQGRSASFGAAFRNGKESFGRLLLFYLFLLLLTLGFFVIIGAVVLLLVFMAASGEVGEVITSIVTTILTLVFVGLLLSSFGYLFVCTAWIVGPLLLSILFAFSIRAAVLESLRPVAAIKRGGRVMLDNLSRSLLLFLLSVGISIGAGIAFLLVAFVVSIPSGAAWIIAYNLDFPLAWIVAASVLALPALVVMVITAALFNTYFAVFWTDIYLQFTGVIEDTKAPVSAAPPSPPAPLPEPR